MIRVPRRTVGDRIRKIREPTEEVIEDIDHATDFRQEPQREIREDTESDVEKYFEENEEENRQAAATQEKNQVDIHHTDIVENPESKEDEEEVQHMDL